MIYTASYFLPQHHHGKRVAISLYPPKKVDVDIKEKLFAPSKQLLSDFKKR